MISIDDDGGGVAAGPDPVRPLLRRPARCAGRSSVTSRTRCRRRSSAGRSAPACRSRWGSRTGRCGTSRTRREECCRHERRAARGRRVDVKRYWPCLSPAWPCRRGLGAQAPGAGRGPAPVIERVEILNNRYLQKETLLFYVSTKPGDRFDEERLRKDFRRLWDTGFLDDLSLEVLEGRRARSCAFRVTERKRIQIVDYRGSKELSELGHRGGAQGERRGDQDRQLLRPGQGPEGRGDHQGDAAWRRAGPSARSRTRPRTSAGSGQQLSFIIDDGPKAKIQEIVFEGNEVFSDDKLRGQMKKIKQSRLLQPELARGQDDLHRARSGSAAPRTPRATADAWRTTTSTTAT